MQNNLNIFYKRREKISLIRPLLVFNRFQILNLCVFFRIPIYVDSTNRSINFRRNRLRRQIIPLIKVFFNPKINIILNRFISIIDCENNYFMTHLKWVEKFLKIQEPGSKTLNRIQNQKWFVFLPKVLQKKFYRKLLISRFKKLTFDEIEFLLMTNYVYFRQK